MQVCLEDTGSCMLGLLWATDGEHLAFRLLLDGPELSLGKEARIEVRTMKCFVFLTA